MQEKVSDRKLSEANNGFCSGVPLLKNILEGIGSTEFSDLMKYSLPYLLKVGGHLAAYPWIKDSLYQWSRIYEYPYVYSQIREHVLPGARILDAGSGVTFFPFFLSQGYQVECIDQDDYSRIFNAISTDMSTHVSFQAGALTKLPFEAQSLDCVYCISVLEHTDRYPEIISEFARVLKPGARLILTFDIALDSNRFGINIDGAVKLLSCLKNSFVLDREIDAFLENLRSKDVYSTHSLSSKEMYGLLPWPKFNWKQLLWSLIRRRPVVNNPLLTVCAVTASRV